MKRLLQVFCLVCIVSILLSGCGAIRGIRNVFHFGEREELYYGVTAKQWLTPIDEKAKKWKPDAYFFGISETEVLKDGSSDKWNYLYYSPGSEKTAAFNYDSGFVQLKEMVLHQLNPVKDFNIDSPTALNTANSNAAKTFLEKNPQVNIIMALIGPDYESSYRNPSRWMIKYYGSSGQFVVIVNATTGEVIQVISK
jgi:uncharacterized protein YceK